MQGSVAGGLWGLIRFKETVTPILHLHLTLLFCILSSILSLE